jgi:predicted transposase/invertase (TIGR01784 family)
MQFADVTNDIAFRKIFGDESRKDVLISFLNAILGFEGHNAIVAVEILNPFQLPVFRDGKATIIDVKARDQGGREFIVEMQVAEVHGFSKRALYYSSQSYSAQIERGEFYEDLRPVIFVGILEFQLTESDACISRHQVRNVDTGEHVVKDMEFTFVELPKFTKTEQELETLTDKWIYFIKNADNLEVIPEHVDDSALRHAYQAANIQTWDKEEYKEYDYASMREQDERGKLKAAELRGEKKGKIEGKIEAAKGMKALGLGADIIAAATGLAPDDIHSL